MSAKALQGLVLFCLRCLGLLASLPLALGLAPSSQCWARDSEQNLYDFTGWVGKRFTLTDLGGTLFTLRFCQDVHVLTQDNALYNFGHFRPENRFFANPDRTFTFKQEYSFGDLVNCTRHAFDFSGRDTQIDITCNGGDCPNGGRCWSPMDDGCLCTAQFDVEHCRVQAVLSLACVPKGPRVLRGVTVGLTSRGKELVDDGVAQWGFDSRHPDYSFSPIQKLVVLYLSSLAEVSDSILQPTFTVTPSEGLLVSLHGSAARGIIGTTEAPSVLQVGWQCLGSTALTYEVNVTFPVQGYSPISFILGKHCDGAQLPEDNSHDLGWAVFGMMAAVFSVSLTLLCCLGIVYNVRVQDKRGLDAVPALPLISSCLDLLTTGTTHIYSPAALVSSGYDRLDHLTLRTHARDSPTANGSLRTPKTSSFRSTFSNSTLSHTQPFYGSVS